MKQKLCRKCKQFLPANTDHFYLIGNNYESPCKTCRFESVKKFRINNPDKIKIISKRYYEKNKEKIYKNTKAWRDQNREQYRISSREYKRKLRKENPEKEKSTSFKRHLKWLYNLSLEDYEFFLIKQNNKCAICYNLFDLSNNKNIHVDHDHRTNKIRGLLCMSCNLLLGHAKDSKILLQQAITYLEINDEITDPK